MLLRHLESPNSDLLISRSCESLGLGHIDPSLTFRHEGPHTAPCCEQADLILHAAREAKVGQPGLFAELFADARTRERLNRAFALTYREIFTINFAPSLLGGLNSAPGTTFLTTCCL